MSDLFDQGPENRPPDDQRSYDPKSSYALSASAGSGKTFALTTRLLGMLLSGVSPNEVLAITFTKLAANEIRDGLFKRLSALESGEKAETRIYADLLKADKKKLAGMARALRFELVEKFSLLRVSTIHSFLGGLIGLFPETGFMLDLKIIDEKEREGVLKEAFDDFYALLAADFGLFERILSFIRTYREGRAQTARAIQEIYTNVEKKKFILRDLLRSEKERSLGLLSEYEERRGVMRSGEILRSVELLASVCSSYLEEWGENKNLRSFLNKLTLFLEYKNPRTLWELSALKRSEEEGPIRYLKTMTKRIEKQKASRFKDTFSFLKEETGRYLASEMDYYIDTWFEIFRRIHSFYEERKRSRRSVDFDDFETCALGLLEGISDYDYLDYRLDSKIRYVLIDEFQDTSESQWEVLRHFVRRAQRSGGNFFYVGDVKQSIYRFRGGEPWLFEKVREGLDLPLHSLEYSYRQNRILLEFVNRIFKKLPDYGYETQALPPGHGGKDRGHLHIERFESKEEVLPGVLEKTRELEREGVALSDIAVLCRRNAEAEEIESLFLSNGIPYRTAGRSLLLGDQAVLDIVNLIKLCISPAEPLFLAGFLRSRMANLRYGELEALGEITFEMLRKRVPDLAERIRSLVEGSRYMLPSEFLWRAYDEYDVLGAYTESREPLLDLLEVAHLFEDRPEVPTLEHFALWIEENRDVLPIKSGAGRGVTVQTIHQSKGLEYHTVIVPYLSQQFKLKRDGSLLYTRDREGRVDRYGIASPRYVDWLGESRQMQAVIEENNREHRIDELNILYVALTRARENLAIFPVAGKGETVGDVMLSSFDENFSREELTYIKKVGRIVQSEKEKEHVEHAYERHLLRPGPEPSGFAGEDLAPVSLDIRHKRLGLLKGLLFHKALEMSKKLPSPDEVDALIERACVMVGSEYTKDERQKAKMKAKRSLEGTIADARLEPYFGDNAVSEVDTLSSQYKNLMGRADRVVFGESIAIIDFKTDETGGERGLGSLVSRYRQQVESYGSSFANLYQNRRIEGWLYFTDAPLEERLVKVYTKEVS
jgi:exodeoxyribonuclease V beta subunit